MFNSLGNTQTVYTMTNAVIYVIVKLYLSRKFK